MGDLVGQAVDGTLYYLSYDEFQRIRALKISGQQRAKIFADMCRLNTLYMIARAGSGHIGSSFSSLDIVSWLVLEELREVDIYFSSKGHDVPGYYAALLGIGKIKFDLIHKLRRIDGLPGHPDIGTPGIHTNTGSLGMGISKAKGMVLANRHFKKKGRVFVLTGDGELQEGQFWESLGSAVNLGLHEIIAIIDHNKLQSDTFVKTVSDLGDLEAKLLAFGWCVARCDGNDVAEFANTLREVKDDPRPKVIIADTVKGEGVSFMEHTALDTDVAMYRFHSGAPDAKAYLLAAQEIIERLHRSMKNIGGPLLKFEMIEREATAPSLGHAQRLIPAYTNALLEQAKKHPNLVALDADLILDTGLIPFRDKYPESFIECGIAEQDMVSMAGGMALKGLLPIVHSFACFLSSRPNEQIYNNATEKTKIIYVGSLAGLLPGGPGHSHQAVRDISVLAAVPGLTIVEPSCEREVGMLFNWCINHAEGSSYMRLTSLPWKIPYQLPDNYFPKVGQGVCIRDGHDLAIISYGPVLLSQAILVADQLQKEVGLSIKVINHPWLNSVDIVWLKREITGFNSVICLDNHYIEGGTAEMIIRKGKEAEIFTNIKVMSVGLDMIPPSGSVNEVLQACRLDTESLIHYIKNLGFGSIK